MEYFVYMGSMITNDARRKLAREIKFRIVMTGAAFNMEKNAAANWM